MVKYFKSAPTNDEIQTYIKKRIKIDPISNCWEWNLSIHGTGYGILDRGTRAFKLCKTELVHRVSFLVFHGPIPKPLVVRHRCNNKICCNPEHLELGTTHQNIKDKYESIESMTTPALHNYRKRINNKIQNLHELNEQIVLELTKRKAPNF